MLDCSRGSEWRKWDLHVHTPASVLNNQFGADWDKYVYELFTKAKLSAQKSCEGKMLSFEKSSLKGRKI